jgi:hypothetical protein
VYFFALHPGYESAGHGRAEGLKKSTNMPSAAKDNHVQFYALFHFAI